MHRRIVVGGETAALLVEQAAKGIRGLGVAPLQRVVADSAQVNRFARGNPGQGRRLARDHARAPKPQRGALGVLLDGHDAEEHVLLVEDEDAERAVPVRPGPALGSAMPRRHLRILQVLVHAGLIAGFSDQVADGEIIHMPLRVGRPRPQRHCNPAIVRNLGGHLPRRIGDATDKAGLEVCQRDEPVRPVAQGDAFLQVRTITRQLEPMLKFEPGQLTPDHESAGGGRDLRVSQSLARLRVLAAVQLGAIRVRAVGQAEMELFILEPHVHLVVARAHAQLPVAIGQLGSSRGRRGGLGGQTATGRDRPGDQGARDKGAELE